MHVDARRLRVNPRLPGGGPLRKEISIHFPITHYLDFVKLSLQDTYMYIISVFLIAEPYSLVGSVQDLRSLVRSPARPIFFLRIDDGHCDRIHFSPTTLHCFDNGYVGKQPVAWKEYCADKRSPGRHC